MPHFTVYLTDNREHTVHTRAIGIKGVEHEEFFAREDIDLNEQGVITGPHTVIIEGEWNSEDDLIEDLVSSLDGWNFEIEEI